MQPGAFSVQGGMFISLIFLLPAYQNLCDSIGNIGEFDCYYSFAGIS